jgi:hypothetical protein
MSKENMHQFDPAFAIFCKALTTNNQRIAHEYCKGHKNEELKTVVHSTYTDFFLRMYDGINFDQLYKRLGNDAECKPFKYFSRRNPLKTHSKNGIPYPPGIWRGGILPGIASFNKGNEADRKSMDATAAIFKSDPVATKYLKSMSDHDKCNIVATELNSLLQERATELNEKHCPDFFRCTKITYPAPSDIDSVMLDLVRTFEH